eukprot:scaffold2635_cov106-Isochrysis_galbana.AAC.6
MAPDVAAASPMGSHVRTEVCGGCCGGAGLAASSSASKTGCGVRARCTGESVTERNGNAAGRSTASTTPQCGIEPTPAPPPDHHRKLQY